MYLRRKRETSAASEPTTIGVLTTPDYATCSYHAIPF
ncbi:hypothetical protein CCACVL1_10078 [Corchorus capsularis]|uniref:Uncharacterized protein n=1 Tax=Corchorus capsularis TaxID=210143 RepID=A0A1R3IST6_COCAP|nr:hypothetical protein CCACVL1_10078 [Corchorus capsularis]